MGEPRRQPGNIVGVHGGEKRLPDEHAWLAVARASVGHTYGGLKQT